MLVVSENVRVDLKWNFTSHWLWFSDADVVVVLVFFAKDVAHGSFFCSQNIDITTCSLFLKSRPSINFLIRDN